MIYTNEIIKDKNNKKQKKQKVLAYIVNVFIAIVLIIIAYIGYQKYIKKSSNIEIFGFKFYTVLTGSMEPNYNVGDLVIGKKIEQNNIKVDDVITFSVDSKNTMTHRVVEIVEENGEILYKTKGDNNNSPDPDLVKYSQIQGYAFFKIDKLGKLITEFVSGIGIVIVIAFVVISYLRSSRNEEKRIAREDARRRYNIPKYKKEEV